MKRALSMTVLRFKAPKISTENSNFSQLACEVTQYYFSGACSAKYKVKIMIEIIIHFASSTDLIIAEFLKKLNVVAFSFFMNDLRILEYPL